MGRPPIPIEEHLEKGTYRRDRHRSFSLVPIEAPRPAKWLGPAARKKWKEIATQLADADIVTVLDIDAMAGYCVAYATWKAAAETIEKEGVTYQSGTLRKVHPAAAVLTAANADMLRWGEKLGLSPSSRRRLRIDTSRPKLTQPDPKDVFFRKREA
jgi:P27 family predicted phage terminase small subunit